MTEAFLAHAASVDRGPLKSLFWKLSARARSRRAAYLRSHIVGRVKTTDRCLDLGGGTGQHFHAVFPEFTNVTVADIWPEALEMATKRFGYRSVLLPETGRLPFADKEFDFVFCSSVIEHCTGPKDEMESMRDGAKFRRLAKESQKIYADEIRRISRCYYVQTPNRNFPVESHSWLPWPYAVLPRSWQVSTLARTRKFWRKAKPNFYLLDGREMRALFPDAMIRAERSLGFVKSWMAIRSH